jgi:hypothetical protein
MATTFHDMGNFLANVANFPFIVNVSKVKLSMYEDVPQKPKIIGRTIMADFTLTTYNAKVVDAPAQN